MADENEVVKKASDGKGLLIVLPLMKIVWWTLR